ncbi:hypothetical protein [Alloactinosynnema sp. L-07]|uniref:S8 family peptidase n=1 Tax=Alloactinosynnema sp. L-07 TaxID=1653480 RepID=UPI00065EEFEC|nr:S8 family peptidase [Alloactinosynnema sp. L-07]CRK56852.1 hypothetical protein [Alloactinosynnema sp. L-07]
MRERDKPHLIIPTPASARAYQPPKRKIDTPDLPAPADRGAHGTQLKADLEDTAAAALERRQEQSITVVGTIEGFYASFDSFPGIELALESLDPRAGTVHPELRAVQEVHLGDGQVVERATVFIPEGKINYFVDRVTRYLETVEESKPRSSNMIDRIQTIRLASIQAMWTDHVDEFPPDGATVWWEVWLRNRDGGEAARLRSFAEVAGLRVGRQVLGFGDRTIMLLQASTEQLASAVDVLDDLAELRRPHDPTQFLAAAEAIDQADWVADLARRVEPAEADAPAVCIVDTGVYRDHPLFDGSLDPDDCHAAESGWPVHDHDGHGTQMAGLALYGDLGSAMAQHAPIRLRHRLESVKLLPPPPRQNPEHLYGAITAAGVSRAEIQAPERPRVFSIAVTAPIDPDLNTAQPTTAHGQPSSWSATLDALAAGRAVTTDDDGLVYLGDAEDTARRLFVVCAGNVREWVDDHLARSDLEPVEDPAQAWNVLTIGAYTEIDTMTEAPSDFNGWTPLASRGQLSPFSRTGVSFGRNWPVKPDVVMEGGNVARSPDGTDFDTPDNLQLLTTDAPLNGPRLLTTTGATSAATAQAAGLAASVMAEYPELWPETVRALIVHSAEWTPAMRAEFPADGGKRSRANRARRYGMGVPNLGRATRSATDALTLIVQDVIHPFADGAMREIHFHRLPWPTDILTELGAAQVRLRVTLSYFIEPNPGRRGWKRRYSYASHGVRFDLRRPTESSVEFQKRVNQKAREAGEPRSTSTSDSDKWFFGAEHRSAPGSLHADVWTGNAADLAQRSELAVFPVTGWWKENPGRDNSDNGARYALVVSIETPEQDVDIWTPVAQQIQVLTTVAVTT